MLNRVDLRSRFSLPAEVRAVYLVRSALYGICTGVYFTGSAVFFVKYVGLSAPDVGLGVSVGFAVGFLLRVPSGRLVDRFGSVRLWLIGTGITGALFPCYLLVGNTAQFVVLTAIISVFQGVIYSAATTYFGEVLPDGVRARGNAYMRSVSNIGSAIGTAICGVLIAVDTRAAYAAIIWIYVAVMAIDFAFIATAMSGPSQRRDRVAGTTAPHGRRSAMRDVRFLAVTTISAVLTLNVPLFVTVLPLWVITATDAPKVIIPVMLILNMALVVLLQVRAAKHAETVVGAIRTQRFAAGVLAAACLVLLTTGPTAGIVTLAALLVAALLITGGELLESAASWGLSYKLSPAEQRGEYLAVFSLGGQLALAAGPALMTVLVLSFRNVGWIVLALLFVVALVLSGPVTRWAAEHQLAAEDVKAAA